MLVIAIKAKAARTRKALSIFLLGRGSGIVDFTSFKG